MLKNTVKSTLFRDADVILYYFCGSFKLWITFKMGWKQKSYPQKCGNVDNFVDKSKFPLKCFISLVSCNGYSHVYA